MLDNKLESRFGSMTTFTLVSISICDFLQTPVADPHPPLQWCSLKFIAQRGINSARFHAAVYKCVRGVVLLVRDFFHLKCYLIEDPSQLRDLI